MSSAILPIIRSSAPQKGEGTADMDRVPCTTPSLPQPILGSLR